MPEGQMGHVAFLLLFLAIPAMAPPILDRRAPPVQDRARTYRQDLDALLKHLDRDCLLLNQKKINWKKTSSTARKRLNAVSSEVEFYGLLAWVVDQLRDSHAAVYPRDPSLPEKWNALQSSRLQVPVGVMPGECELVLVSHVDDSMRERGVEVGAVLAEIDGEKAWDWFEERSRQSYLDGGFSTIHRARTTTYSFGVIVPEGKGVKLGFRRLALSDEDREKYLRYSARKRAGVLKKSGTWEPITVEIAPEHCQPAHFIGHGFPHWRVQGLVRVSDMTSYVELPSGLGYVYLRNVNGDTQPAELQTAFRALQDCPGMVVDMRWNGGGGGENAVAACFPGSGEADDHDKWTKPVAVLIGPRVMSSGDSVAHFLKAWYNHRLFGENTSGASGPKGSFELPSGFASVRYVRSHWKSRMLEGIGVAPDTPVLQDVVELSFGTDSVLAAAERYLEKEIEKR